jgi:hypothetical protein
MPTKYAPEDRFHVTHYPRASERVVGLLSSVLRRRDGFCECTVPWRWLPLRGQFLRQRSEAPPSNEASCVHVRPDAVLPRHRKPPPFEVMPLVAGDIRPMGAPIRQWPADERLTAEEQNGKQGEGGAPDDYSQLHEPSFAELPLNASY